MNDRYDLGRFVAAQDGPYPEVLAELAAGRKTTHWMWYVFPQLRGLGHSAMSRRFGIGSLDEARAYLAHAVLGARLRECTRAMLAVQGADISRILGAPDDRKFHSCMTLFAHASGGEPVFEEALRRFFGGVPDARTLELLAGMPAESHK